MRRPICPEGQADIFPPEVMACCFAHRAPHAPLPPLPFTSNKAVDMSRACRILDAPPTTLRRMLKLKLLRWYQISDRAVRGAPVRIEHTSIVEYCDSLRLQFHLPARKGGDARPRDREVLPFPADETISIGEVSEHLDVSKVTATKLIEEGALAAYKLIPYAASPWRIHRPSFVAYLNRLSERTEAKPTTRSSPR